MIAFQESGDARGGAEVEPGDTLMMLPAAIVAGIEERAVVLCLPWEEGGLRLKRGVYDIYRAFHLPRPVAEVLPEDPERRAKVLQCIRLLASRGFLVPPEVGIATLSGEPAPYAEPDGFSVLA
ncbi:MAG TPA: hypothetical protein VFT45_16380 [Longimicrobium sp.]|nr:hypothetical protein [Longimicrobium sp.]